MDTTMVHYLIGRSRIKYSVLDNLFRDVKFNQPNVVMPIDISAIIYRLYREQDLSMIYNTDPAIVVKDLVVSILNTVAHYRRYFYTRMHKTNDIILFCNLDKPANCYDGYRESWYSQFDLKHPTFGPLNAIVKQAVDFLVGIVPYFEGVYLITGTEIDDYVAMSEMLSDPNNRYDPNLWYRIIFSKNVFLTQLIDTNCSILYPKRDDSYFITNGTCFKNGVLKGRKAGASENLSSKLLPFIWTLSGCSDIGIKRTKFTNGVVDTIKKVNELVDNKQMTNDVSFEGFLRAYATLCPEHELWLSLIPKELKKRYQTMSLSVAKDRLSQNDIIKIWSNVIDLYDQVSLEEINDKLVEISVMDEVLAIENMNMSTWEGMEVPY